MYQKYAELRESHGVTDYEVAKKTGISTATLSSWKNNRYVPKLDKIKAIADYFNVSIEYFLDDES